MSSRNSSRSRLRPSANGRFTAASTALMQFSGARKPRVWRATLFLNSAKISGLPRAGHARQPLGAAGARKQAELYLRQTEARALHAHPVVAGQGDLEPAAECRAMDRRHDRLRRALDQVENRVQTGLLWRLAELRDVGARDEGAAGADDDDRLHRVVADRLLDTVVQALTHVLAEGIDGRVIDSEHGHAAASAEVYGLGDLRHVRLL